MTRITGAAFPIGAESACNDVTCMFSSTTERWTVNVALVSICCSTAVVAVESWLPASCTRVTCIPET